MLYFTIILLCNTTIPRLARGELENFRVAARGCLRRCDRRLRRLGSDLRLESGEGGVV